MSAKSLVRTPGTEFSGTKKALKKRDLNKPGSGGHLVAFANRVTSSPDFTSNSTPKDKN
jgi:hypothetical protein